MELLPPSPLGHHQASLFQLLQVLHHAEPRHPEPSFERGQRLSVLPKELVEEAAAGRICQRPEHPVHMADYK